LNIKGPIVDIDNRTNEVFLSFDLFSSKLSPRGCFSFYSTNRKSEENIKAYICRLDEIILLSSADPKSVVIVSDASIKNQVATSIVHIHVCNSPVLKTIHHAINVTTTEAELFTIKCNINQAICLNNIH